ncbi:cyclic dehypoxanthinyl futalosine synthase [Venenivibrio stagnispumantis]|uniref:Cyclic dehypoxanthine futalosine synthase n=1 Tax=Venenivibrio stagnispumantis TaxID=407998 RepID=A0AA45WLP8_9AQUI|nr:cyclic dehypoxanthinyl futalosine synthase [Venenivibrio stagnispumantis]MCW4573453.1 dehypoxanthine futalosine cyclase [Venenivibrio stagnispumantis]SMP11817.1 de-hypoxanthine futalosine cyclase [Venenivibrio stagnispumantis]
MKTLNLNYIYDKVLNKERISEEEALYIFENSDVITLGKIANYIRKQKHPSNIVTFVVDRNINYTNICVAGCKFCAFQRKKKDKDAYVLEYDEIFRKIQELIDWGGTTLLMQGGLNPDLRLDFYIDLISSIKEKFPNIQIHSLSATEINYIAKLENMSIKDVLVKLKEAGLDSLPGGGAEILSDEVRVLISSNKTNTKTWLEVHKTAHELGMKSTATMMFGHIEKPKHIIEHLSNIRNLQDETGGFTAFIPWTFQKGNTMLDYLEPATSTYYLKVLSLSRIFLDNFDNIQASHVTQTMKIGQVALHFGANDLGSTMIEENVVASTGFKVSYPKPEKMAKYIKEAGFIPAQRDTYYKILKIWE